MAKLTQNEITILISQLEERYKAIHIIRERAQNVCLWILGLFTTVSGWLIQSKINLDGAKKLILALVIISFYLIIRFYYFKDLQKGFVSQQKVAAKIEGSLGLFNAKRYCKDSILPFSWKKAGQKGCEGNFFNSFYVILGLSVVILLLGLLLVGII